MQDNKLTCRDKGYLMTLRSQKPRGKLQSGLISSEEGEEVEKLLRKTVTNYEFSRDTLALGVVVFNLGIAEVRKLRLNEFSNKFIASICLYMAAKYSEAKQNMPPLMEYLYFAGQVYTVQQYAKLQSIVFQIIGFNINISTISSFLNFYLQTGSFHHLDPQDFYHCVQEEVNQAIFKSLGQDPQKVAIDLFSIYLNKTKLNYSKKLVSVSQRIKKAVCCTKAKTSSQVISKEIITKELLKVKKQESQSLRSPVLVKKVECDLKKSQNGTVDTTSNTTNNSRFQRRRNSSSSAAKTIFRSKKSLVNLLDSKSFKPKAKEESENSDTLNHIPSVSFIKGVTSIKSNPEGVEKALGNEPTLKKKRQTFSNEETIDIDAAMKGIVGSNMNKRIRNFITMKEESREQESREHKKNKFISMKTILS